MPISHHVATSGGGGGPGLPTDNGTAAIMDAVHGSSASAKIVAILNSHHDTLASLDAKARQLQQELLAISRDARLAPART